MLPSILLLCAAAILSLLVSFLRKKQLTKQETFPILTAFAIGALSLYAAHTILSTPPATSVTVDVLPAYGDSVTFRGGSVDGQWYHATELHPASGWTSPDGCLLSWTPNTATTLFISLPAGQERYIIFNAGPSEGAVALTVDGVSHTYRLTSSVVEVSEYGISLPSSAPYQPNRSILSVSGLLGFVLALAFVRIARRIPILNRLTHALTKTPLAERAFAQRLFCNEPASSFTTWEISIALPLLLLLSFAYLYAFSLSSTPLLSEFYGYDASIFQSIGAGWANGLIPYRDMFDHKGPFIFFIYLISYWIDADIGIYFIQSLFLFSSLAALYVTARLALRPATSLLSVLFVLSFFIFVIDEGAITEEFNLPVLAWSFYFVLKYFFSAQWHRHPPRYAFFYGFSFAILFFTRVTNAISLCSLIFCILVYLIKSHAWNNLLQNAGAFLLGFFIIFVPVVLYFTAHHATYELFFGTIIYNILYAGASSLQHTPEEWRQIALLSAPFLACSAVSLFYAVLHHRYTGLSFLFAGFCTNLFLAGSFVYPHYYIVGLVFLIPSICMTRILLGARARFSFALSLCIITAFWGLFLSAAGQMRNQYHYVKYMGIDQPYLEYATIVRAQAQVIPEQDYDKVIAYNVDAKWYLYTGILPCFHNYALQDWQAANSQVLTADNERFFSSGRAKWIVVDGNGIQNTKIQTSVREQYRLVSTVEIPSENKQICLYRRNKFLI